MAWCFRIEKQFTHNVRFFPVNVDERWTPSLIHFPGFQGLKDHFGLQRGDTARRFVEFCVVVYTLTVVYSRMVMLLWDEVCTFHDDSFCPIRKGFYSIHAIFSAHELWRPPIA